MRNKNTFRQQKERGVASSLYEVHLALLIFNHPHTF